MTDVPSERKKIQIEEVSYKASISEVTAQKIGGSVNYIIDNVSTQLGDVIHSGLTEAQFQSLRGNNWVQFKGQSIAGSDYALLTGITTLPDVVDGGTTIATDSDANLMTNSSGDNKQHSHDFVANLRTGTSGSFPSSTNSSTPSNTITTTTNGSTSNNLAAGVKVRIFIKINNVPS